MTIGWSMGQLIVDEGATSAIDYCTLADVEAYTGVDFSEGIGATDAQIALMISNASRLVDAYAGTQVAGTVGVTEYFDINGWTKHLVMGIRPVTSITNIYTDVKWYAPKLKFGHLLNVPLHDGENPPCVLFVKEANKLPEVLDISELW